MSRPNSMDSASMTVTGPTPEIAARLMWLPVTVITSRLVAFGAAVACPASGVAAVWAMETDAIPAYSNAPIATARWLCLQDMERTPLTVFFRFNLVVECLQRSLRVMRD
jgi:hypothetical protein